MNCSFFMEAMNMTVEILEHAWTKIMDSVGTYQAESGGVIACNEAAQIVDFFFDSDAGVGNRCYIPNQAAINRHVNQVWRPLGYRFGGVVHSHPEGSSCTPSAPDVKMAEKIILHNGLCELYLVIVQQNKSGIWRAVVDELSQIKVESCDLVIIKQL